MKTIGLIVKSAKKEEIKKPVKEVKNSKGTKKAEKNEELKPDGE